MFNRLNSITRLLIRGFVLIGLTIIFIESFNPATPTKICLGICVAILISDGLWD